jgi:aspartate ammonia-lyase
MNANVIANMALRRIGFPRDYASINPNDHVNLAIHQ